MRAGALALLVGVGIGTALAQDAVPTTDKTAASATAPDAALRDVPIVCRTGELERQPGKTLGQIFGADWPAPSGAGSATLPRVVELGRLSWPSGLEGKRARVIVAVLVGADGKPLRAEPLCATVGGFDHAAHRAAMAGRYEAGTFGGQVMVAPVVTEVAFNPPRRGSSRRADDAGASSSGD